jgi:hypothetical protein
MGEFIMVSRRFTDEDTLKCRSNALRVSKASGAVHHNVVEARSFQAALCFLLVEFLSGHAVRNSKANATVSL